MSTILPLAYLPSVEYFTHLLRGGCVVDLGEHFVKRSERNRARILASDGVMELTVHVRNANRPRQPVCDVRLDYSKRWQHQHWGALVASYRSSPYFDFYAGRFEPFYRRVCWRCCVRWPECRCPNSPGRMSRRPPETSTCAPNAKKAWR